MKMNKHNKSYRVEIGFGIDFDENKTPIHYLAQTAILGMLKEKAVESFGGATECVTSGIWKNPDGHVYSENGRTILLLGSGQVFLRKAREFAAHVRDSLKQECVCFTVSECSTELI